MMRSVVIADDEVLQRQMLREGIEWAKYGLTVIAEAKNGRMALEVIRQHPPDLLVTDIRMPGMTGLELLAEAQQIRSDLQSIVISGYDDFTYAQEAIQLHASCYLLKPFTEEQMDEALWKVVRIMDEQEDRDAEVELLRQRMLAGVKGVLGKGEQDHTESALAALAQAVVLAVQSGDGGKTAQALDAFLNYLSDGQSLDSRYTRTASLGVLADLMSAVYDLRLDATDTRQFSEINWEEALRKETIPDLRAWMHGVIRPIVAAVARRKHGKNRRVVEMVRQYIMEHLAEDLTVKQVADHVFMSTNHLSTLFKQEQGETFSEYLTWARIERAKELLGRLDTKIYEVAEQVGYHSVPHFYEVFKKVTGMTPSQFRDLSER